VELTWEGWLTLATIAGVFGVLIRNLAPPDITLLSAGVFLGLCGVLSVQEVFVGFLNEGVLTIAPLFVVAAAMGETGAMDLIASRLFGRARTERGAVVRMGLSVIPLSAFLNNTPVVAMLVPQVISWSRKHNVAASKLLIPLSYFAMLGGTCTLIGTSTNIVVNGLIRDEQARLRDATHLDASALESAIAALQPIGMFEIAWIGLPFALIGVVYMVVVGRKLLPSRGSYTSQDAESSRSYLIDLRIQPGCRLAGQSVTDAGLRHLSGLYLVEIVREGRSISPVSPNTVLRENDILTFTGVGATIVELERIPGLVPVADEAYIEASAHRLESTLCEAVISATSPLIGKNVRDAEFRAAYNAAIIAVHRGGQRLKGRVGDIVLRHGDTLLLQGGPHFIQAHRNNPDFYLVSGVEESRAARTERAPVAYVLLFGLVALMSTASLTGIAIPIAAWVIAVLMVATQCISPSVARQSVDWQTVLAIAGAIALGIAMEKHHVAAAIAGTLVDVMKPLGPYALLAVIYITTSVLTECVTTKGAAVLMFPIAVASAIGLDLSPRPFVMAVLFAAAASFVTPLGYQTNLMVFGPGGYKFSDFLRVGIPLNAMLITLAVILIPLIWGF